MISLLYTYTSIPHTQLKANLLKFINRVFGFKEKPFIIPNIYTKRAYFSQGRSSNKTSFSKDELIECVNYLIDNSFVIYQGKIYKQVIGIPMGTNAGPQIANTYLHVYEYEYIKKLIEMVMRSHLRAWKLYFDIKMILFRLMIVVY